MNTNSSELGARKTSILVVEDNPADQRLIREYLGNVDGEEYEIEVVDNLEAARSVLTKSPDAFDVILLDHNLGDGISVDLIREMSESIAAPMILLTGLASRDVDESAMEAGASDFLPKNELNSLILDRTVRHAIERQRTGVELRQKYVELKDTNFQLKKTTAQLEAEGANIIKLTEHLAKAPEGSDISFLKLDDGNPDQEQIKDSGSIGVWHITPKGATLELNQPMRTMLGLRESENLEGKSFWHQFRSQDRSRARRELSVWSNGVTSSFEADTAVRGKDRESRMVLSGCPIQDDDGNTGSIMITAVDVTDRRQAEIQIKNQAQRDPLTGLLNRMVSREMLANAMSNNDRNGTDLAVFYLDLDDFKEINDTLGHQAGDEYLKQVSERLQANIRDSDFVARLGGDEFMIVLNNLQSLAGAAKVAQSMLEALHAPCIIDGKDREIKASIGIAMFPDDSRDPDQLIKDADLALYRSKEAGGDMYQFFDSEMRDYVEQRRNCQTDLVKAIDIGGFRIAYQPQITLNGGRIAGVEALIRWDRPGYGLCAPDAFLPIAEETGLIIPIGDWVVNSACAAMAARQKLHGENLRLAINLSARQLKQPQLAARIGEILSETGFSPTMLEVEITETAVIDDIEASVLVINTLRDLGVSISLDDFGTGYSSLSVLKQFAVDSLKIDRGFVKRICDNPMDAAIVESTISLGARLGFRVVAEGVETIEQLELLRSLGCHEAQGYFFSKPLFTDALETWLNDFKIDTDGQRKIMPVTHPASALITDASRI